VLGSYKISNCNITAADDAVGLAISTRMDSQVRAMSMQVRNASDGVSLIQSAEGALQETTNILQRMYELSVQASNETFNDSDRTAIQAEVTQLQAEIDRIAKDTQFNGQNILDGNFLSKTLNVGFTDKGSIRVSIGDQGSAALSGAGATDALSSLMNSVSNIALGADTQTAVASTATAAVVKVDSQTAAVSQSQFNVGFDATQSLTASTSVRNLAAGAATATTAQIQALTLTTVADGDTITIGGVAGEDVVVTLDGVTGANVTAAATAVSAAINAAGGKTVTAVGLAGVITLTAASAGTGGFTPSFASTGGPAIGTIAAPATPHAGPVAHVAVAVGNGVATAAAAGARDTQVAKVDTVTSATGLDSIVDVSSNQLTGAVKLNDVISFTAVAGGNAVAYTVTADDLVADATQSKRNAIDSFVNRFNSSSTEDRFDATGGVLTASRSEDDVITSTASVASAIDIASAIVVADRDNTAAIVVAGNATTAANGSVGATAIAAIGGSGSTLQEGDTLTMDITGNLSTAFVYTITREDIGAENTTTLENVRASFIAAFNASDEAKRQNAQSGVISAAASSTNSSAIVFTGADTTNNATFAYDLTGANGTDDVLDVVAVTTATNEAGTAVGPVEDNNRVATASTKIVNFDAAEIETGDVIELDVAGTKVSYTVATGDNANAISAALMALINDVGSQGERISTDGAGIIAATNNNGVLTLTSANTGSGSDFDVTTTTTNFSGRVQNSAFDLSGTNSFQEGDTIRLSLSDNNFIEAVVTKEMVDLGAAGARESVIAALVAQSDDLQGVRLETVDNEPDRIRIVGDDIGVAFTANISEVNRTAQKQQDVVSIGGEVGKGDVFTLTVGGVAASVTVGDDIASIRSNDDRITAVRDALRNVSTTLRQWHLDFRLDFPPLSLVG